MAEPWMGRLPAAGVVTKRDLPFARPADNLKNRWPRMPWAETAALGDAAGEGGGTGRSGAAAARGAVAEAVAPLLGGGWNGEPWIFTRGQLAALAGG